MRSLSNGSPFTYRPPVVRWVDYARRSWQRLGYLTIVTALADSSTGTTLEGLTSRFEAVVTRLHEIPDSTRGQVIDYIRSHRPNRYPRSNGTIARVELQDLYLADPRLPSHSGAITGDMEAAGYRHAVYVEIPAWAMRLRLLRRENYTITDRGKALLRLRSGGLRYLHEYDPVSNPFLLTVGERYFFLYCVLDADGDLIQRVFSSLLTREAPFTRSDVGEIAADSLVRLSDERLRRVLSGQTRTIASRMTATVESVRNRSGAGMGPRESVATPRTEPLVDCGLLCRADPTAYSYRVTDEGREFATEMVQSRSIDEFLEARLAACTAKLANLDLPAGTNEVFPYIARSYALLRSGLGYCSIREVALLAVSMALDRQSRLFELCEAERAIAEAARRYGREVRFTKSRQGDIALVRIAPRVLAELTDEYGTQCDVSKNS